MITGRIYSDTVIENPSRYLDAVFGRYWRTIERTQTIGNGKSVVFTAGEEVRRVCEVSRNIEFIAQVPANRTWEDGSPCPLETDDIPF